MITNTRISLALIALTALPSLRAAADDLFGVEQPLPEVLTATRLKQAPAAVPGSMSVLDSALIHASGARDLVELLRLVPGMMIGYRNGNQATANYHGSNVTQARRLQVLVDGRSVYHPGLATVDWTDIPVAIEDIERIEVFRGPNTVSYGANALMGVINIITRAPLNSQGSRLKTTQGQNGIQDWYASHGVAWTDGALRLSLSGQQDEGFDHDEFGSDYRDSRRLNRLNLSVSQQIDSRNSLDWQLAIKEGSNQNRYEYQPLFGNYAAGDDNSDIEARDYAAALRWNIDFNNRHSLLVSTSAQHWERLSNWRACDAAIVVSPQLGQLWRLNPAFTERFARSPDAATIATGTPQEQALATQVAAQLASGGLDQVCGEVNQDLRESRYEMELQDTLSLTDDLRLLSGASYRHDITDSATYFSGRLRNDIWRLFGHLEWQASAHWLLQAGAMYENDQRGAESFTPRLAANYLFAPNHGLRVVYSEAVRSPDMLENDANWNYQVRHLDPNPFGLRNAPYFITTPGPGNLKQERMRSWELGYNGQFDGSKLNLDIKLFDERIDDMISEPLSNGPDLPSNDNWMRFQGAETQVDWHLSQADRLRLSYAYVDFVASSRLDQRLTARHSGSTGWLRDWGQGWSSGLFYYAADQLNGYRFERMDLRIAKRFPLAGSVLELASVVQHRLDDEPLTWRENNQADNSLLYFTVELEF